VRPAAQYFFSIDQHPFSRDKFTIHSKAVVCQDVDLKGDITIGPGSVVHPKATIFALAGPIIIGSGCTIEEAAIIVNRRKEVMRIGDNNLFEIGCRASMNSYFSDATFG
jgi:dynactin-6